MPGLSSDTRPLALTMGDPAGISAEITVAAWRALRTAKDLSWFISIDDPRRLKALGVPVIEIEDAREASLADFQKAIPVLAELLPSTPTAAKPGAEHAQSVLNSIDRAVALALTGEVSAVVTNPINKKALYDGVDFPFGGHTEYLAHIGGASRSVMMLVGVGLRVVPTTIHVPLSRVMEELTPTLLQETLEITHAALRRDFGVAAPRIAVSGLNPHAGEKGSIGREEIEMITPVLDRMRSQGMHLLGPSPADTLFHEAARERYDAAVCMFHDQALIPVKTLAFDEGVNATLGLPFIRTSPDHGVAYDIAGRGVARADSLLAAIRLAGEMAARRAAFDAARSPQTR
ncbi:MAG: 4-hydroxythreonine-4-phosphate dehydrogenase PdxA [Neomegalonema sp.]